MGDAGLSCTGNRAFKTPHLDRISHYDRMETFDWWHNLELNHESGYSTHLINRHALKFIEQNKSTSNKLRGLKGEPLPKRRLFWALQGGRAAAVREGPWKLVVAGKGPAKLYNLKEDLKEANDRAADHPQLARKFSAALEAWQAEVRASATVQPPAPTGAK